MLRCQSTEACVRYQKYRQSCLRTLSNKDTANIYLILES